MELWLCMARASWGHAGHEGGGGLGQVMGCRGAPPSMGGDTDVAPCVATIFDVPITRKVGWVIRGTTGLDANMGLTLSLGEEGWGLPEECNTPFL
jgi:hypothetical protein